MEKNSVENSTLIYSRRWSRIGSSTLSLYIPWDMEKDRVEYTLLLFIPGDGEEYG